jgi:hypothetical protein
MKPVNPTMSERIVKKKIRFANDVSMKMVAERHDLGRLAPYQRASDRANKRSMIA